MVKKNTLYKCEICGNVVDVVSAAAPEIHCCGQPMNEIISKTIEQEGKEKHIPIVTIEGNNINVKVGEIAHPMTEEHYIQLIQVVKDGKIIKEKRLCSTDSPEATFILDSVDEIKVRAFCNVHGLWIN
jgi:superoxide reductase